MTKDGTYRRCGGKTRSGGQCTQPAGWGTSHPGEGKCKLHGGASPRGADSPHFKHGIYSQYMPARWRDKAESMEASLDLLPELMLLRAILAEYLSRFETFNASADDIDVIRVLANEIRKITDSIVKQRNSTALTAVEIAMLVDKIPLLVIKYVTGTENQRQFIAELFSLTTGGDAGFEEAQQPASLIADSRGTD